MLFNISVCFRRMLHISLILRRRIDKKVYLVNDLFPPQRPLCVGGRLGRGKKESPRRRMGRGKRAFSPFPSSTAHLLFINYCEVYDQYFTSIVVFCYSNTRSVPCLWYERCSTIFSMPTAIFLQTINSKKLLYINLNFNAHVTATDRNFFVF